MFPVYKKSNKDSNYRTIDGLSFLTEDVLGESRGGGHDVRSIFTVSMVTGLTCVTDILCVYIDVVPSTLMSCSVSISASKSHMQGSIYLWSWGGTMALHQGRKKEVPAVILAELQWTNTDIPYLSLNTCPGQHHSDSILFSMYTYIIIIYYVHTRYS